MAAFGIEPLLCDLKLRKDDLRLLVKRCVECIQDTLFGRMLGLNAREDRLEFAAVDLIEIEMHLLVMEYLGIRFGGDNP